MISSISSNIVGLSLAIIKIDLLIYVFTSSLNYLIISKKNDENFVGIFKWRVIRLLFLQGASYCDLWFQKVKLLVSTKVVKIFDLGIDLTSNANISLFSALEISTSQRSRLLSHFLDVMKREDIFVESNEGYTESVSYRKVYANRPNSLFGICYLNSFVYSHVNTTRVNEGHVTGFQVIPVLRIKRSISENVRLASLTIGMTYVKWIVLRNVK